MRAPGRPRRATLRAWSRRTSRPAPADPGRTARGHRPRAAPRGTSLRAVPCAHPPPWATARRMPARLEPLDPGLHDAFRRELDETRRRRLLVLAPLMVALHVAHVVAFRTADADRLALDARYVA